MPGPQHLLVLLVAVAAASEHIATVEELGHVSSEPASQGNTLVQQNPMPYVPSPMYSQDVRQQVGDNVRTQYYHPPWNVQKQQNTQYPFPPAFYPQPAVVNAQPTAFKPPTTTLPSQTSPTKGQDRLSTKTTLAANQPSPTTTTRKPQDTPLSSIGSVQELRPVIQRGLLELCLGLERVGNRLDSMENTVLAPLSVAGIAALLLAGANGQTRKELERLFGVEDVPHKQEEVHAILSLIFSQLEATEKEGLHLAFGSGLFVQEGDPLSEGYLKLAREAYHSEIIPVDFKRAAHETSVTINKWVANRTEGQIKKLLEDAIEPSTTMIIANVFYFKGAWEQPFIQKITKMQKFHVSRTEALSVPLMMGIMTVPYARVRGSHSIIGLPYKGGDTIMYFVLPDGGLRNFVSGLTPETLLNYLNRTVVQSTIVAIPRMRVEGSMELSGPLSALGVESLFRPGKADLSGIGKGYHVSEMIHKVSLEVTETGTVGAAASAATVLRGGDTPLFRADRPFLFFVYHRPTGSILFWGTVFRPRPVLYSSSSKP